MHQPPAACRVAGTWGSFVVPRFLRINVRQPYALPRRHANRQYMMDNFELPDEDENVLLTHGAVAVDDWIREVLLSTFNH